MVLILFNNPIKITKKLYEIQNIECFLFINNHSIHLQINHKYRLKKNRLYNEYDGLFFEK